MQECQAPRSHNTPSHQDPADNKIEDYETQLWALQMAEVFHPRAGLARTHQKQLKKMKIGTTTKDCSICCLSFSKGEVIYRLPCMHIYHTECLTHWLHINQTCPMCRLHLAPLL